MLDDLRLNNETKAGLRDCYVQSQNKQSGKMNFNRAIQIVLAGHF